MRKRTGLKRVRLFQSLENWFWWIALESVIKADHGYNLDSRAVKNLIDVMSSYTVEERRAFLQLYVYHVHLVEDKRPYEYTGRRLINSITGAPKLPIGGFRGLTPPFTVVRKPHEPPFKADDYLPSVMTCAQVCVFLLSSLSILSVLWDWDLWWEHRLTYSTSRCLITRLERSYWHNLIGLLKMVDNLSTFHRSVTCFVCICMIG